MNEKVIICKGLTKKFGDFVAVDHISFEVNKGEIFGFLGANGAGNHRHAITGFLSHLGRSCRGRFNVYRQGK